MFAPRIKLPPQTVPISRELRRALKLTKNHQQAPSEELSSHSSWDIYDEDDVKIGTAINRNRRWEWK